MGSAAPVHRLVRVSAPGCEHHVLLRAGRPAYANPDQAMNDAADDLADHVLDALTTWYRRWWLPRRCPAHPHDEVVVGTFWDVEEPAGEIGARLVTVEVDGARLVVDAPGLPVLYLTERSGEGDLRDV